MYKRLKAHFAYLAAMSLGSCLVFSAGLLFSLPANAQSVGNKPNNPLMLLRGSEDADASGEPVFQGLMDGETLDETTDTLDEPSERSVLSTNDQAAVDQLQGRARRVQSDPGVLDDINTATPSARANVRAGQVEPGNPRAVDEDPFAAQGFSVGTWNGNASVEQSIGYTNNLNKAAMQPAGAFSQTDVNLDLQSDWSRHQAQITATGSYQRNFDDAGASVPSAGVSGLLRLDLQDAVSLTFATSYNYSTESVTSTTIGAVVDERPGAHSINGSVTLANTSQRLNYSLRGSVDRNMYEDASLSGGGILSQKDRNNNLYRATARVGYEVSPSFTPFVEASIGRRDFDLDVDRNGQISGADVYSVAVGSEIDLGEKVDGEFSIGYQVEDFDDAGLENLQGFTVDASLNWSPWRETVVGLTASTNFRGSASAGQSGTIVHSLGASIERQITDRLSVDLSTSADITQDSNGDVDTILLSTGAGFAYSINKNLAITGDVDFERQLADTGGQRYDAGTVQAGVRWQK